MSVTDGPNLGLMISAADGDAFGTQFRAFLRALDALLQGAVISKALTAPPGSPANGDRYIVGASATGAWAGKDKNVAVWTMDNPAAPTGEWEFYPPKTGWVVYNATDARLYSYSGLVWTPVGPAASTDLSDVSGWQNYTPVVTAYSGSFTTVTATGRYLKIGKLVNFTVTITFTDIGSGAVATFVTLPFTAGSSQSFSVVGKEIAAVGFMYVGQISPSGTTMSFDRYDAAFGVANGYQIVMSGCYESA